MSPKLRVAVLGAGAAGLCALKHLQDRPEEFDAVAFERADSVGGTWIYTEETGLDRHGLPVFSSMYRDLITNLPKEVMAFPGFPFDDSLPSFVTQKDVIQYLENYAEHFDLYKNIQFEKFVEQVHAVDGDNGKVKWEVTVKDLNSKVQTTETFDAVFICNGHYSVPYIPHLEGMEQFTGKMCHSHSFRHPDEFRDQVVVILGAANSGQDISIEISQTAKQVYLSHIKARFQSPLPANVEQVPGIRSLGPDNAVTFLDGRTVQTDIFLFCTGYHYSFPFLSNKCALDTSDERLHLYKHILHLDYPSLAFIGIPKAVSPFPVFHYQVLFTLVSWTGKIPIPSRKEMEADVEQELQKVLALGLPPRHAHTMGPRQFGYIDNLAKLIGCHSIPRYVSMIFDATLQSRNKNLLTYRKVNYEITGPESFNIVQ